MQVREDEHRNGLGRCTSKPAPDGRAFAIAKLAMEAQRREAAAREPLRERVALRLRAVDGAATRKETAHRLIRVGGVARALRDHRSATGEAGSARKARASSSAARSAGARPGRAGLEAGCKKKGEPTPGGADSPKWREDGRRAS